MSQSRKWLTIQKQAESCTACRLSGTRSRVVFGEGSSETKIIFIGEGPGRQEDLTGRPFIGRAGDLLTRLIEKEMKLSRSEVYITNIVKCRPTVDLKMEKDRAPEKDETEACTPFLLKQIEIIKPKVIITLGNPATRFILNTKSGITSIHGSWDQFMDIPVMPVYHPSYLLRNGGEKSRLYTEAAEDLKEVIKFLNK